MQPISGPKMGAGDRNRLDNSLSQENSTRITPQDAALSSVQRTTLERTIVRIMAISNLKSAELWAGVRHQVGVQNDGELLSSHFTQAEAWLNQRLLQEEEHHTTRRALQQLSELLPRGNNRQAVSDYIRHQFGQTVLSALTLEQLQQVLQMLKQGQMDIPPPIQNPTSDRSLLPAEHQALNQQLIKLSMSCGESPQLISATLYSMMGLKNGDPIPAKFYAPLSQYLQARMLVIPPARLSLNDLLHGLKQPPTVEESQRLSDYSRSQYGITPATPLSTSRAQDLLYRLFCQRAGNPSATQPMATQPQSISRPQKDHQKPTATGNSAQRWIIGAIIIAVLIGCWLL